MTSPGARAEPIVRQPGNAYQIFILVLTLLSLAVMALQLMPLSEPVHNTLLFYDNLICVVFLADFLYNLSGSHPRREYFIHHRGWLDLLGSIPALGIFRFTALFRLARLSRLARIMRLLGGQKKKELVRDLVQNRGQYALFVTLLLVMIVLTTASVLVLQFESQSPDANIKTGGDALWWAFVTITTVGYGDRFPVTELGRMTGVFVMFAGVGIIGALASILASLLVSPAPTELMEDDAAPTPVPDRVIIDTIHADLAETRAEIAELRRLLAERK